MFYYLVYWPVVVAKFCIFYGEEGVLLIAAMRFFLKFLGPDLGSSSRTDYNGHILCPGGLCPASWSASCLSG